MEIHGCEVVSSMFVGRGLSADTFIFFFLFYWWVSLKDVLCVPHTAPCCPGGRRSTSSCPHRLHSTRTSSCAESTTTATVAIPVSAAITVSAAVKQHNNIKIQQTDYRTTSERPGSSLG